MSGERLGVEPRRDPVLVAEDDEGGDIDSAEDTVDAVGGGGTEQAQKGVGVDAAEVAKDIEQAFLVGGGSDEAEAFQPGGGFRPGAGTTHGALPPFGGPGHGVEAEGQQASDTGGISRATAVAGVDEDESFGVGAGVSEGFEQDLGAEAPSQPGAALHVFRLQDGVQVLGVGIDAGGESGGGFVFLGGNEASIIPEQESGLVREVFDGLAPGGIAGAKAIGHDDPGTLATGHLVRDFGSVQRGGMFGRVVDGGHERGLFDGKGWRAR